MRDPGAYAAGNEGTCAGERQRRRSLPKSAGPSRSFSPGTTAPTAATSWSAPDHSDGAPSEARAAIVINLSGELRSRLRPPCRVLGEFGVRRPDRDDSFYQFDLGVTCAPADPARRYIAEPELIIEVLSPSTALHDRGRKLDHYRQLPSLKEILLVASEERRVQHWRREGARWTVDDLIGDADLRLATVPEPIPFAAIYESSDI